MYDAFAILAWVVVLVTLGRRPGWQLAAGVLAGFQDFEQMTVGLLMVALLPGLARAAGLRPRVAYLLGGTVAGKFALEVYLHAVGAGPGSRLSYLARGCPPAPDMAAGARAAGGVGGLHHRADGHQTRHLRNRDLLTVLSLTPVAHHGRRQVALSLVSPCPADCRRRSFSCVGGRLGCTSLRLRSCRLRGARRC